MRSPRGKSAIQSAELQEGGLKEELQVMLGNFRLGLSCKKLGRKADREAAGRRGFPVAFGRQLVCKT